MKLMNQKSVKKQQGVALVMALIMLLAMTVIGVSAVRMSTLSTQISGNSMFSLMVFQGAESALNRVSTNGNIFNINQASLSKPNPWDVPAVFFPNETVNNIANSGLNTTATIVYESVVSNSSLYNTVPNSSLFTYRVFRTTANTELRATSARAEHVDGVAIQLAPGMGGSGGI